MLSKRSLLVGASAVGATLVMVVGCAGGTEAGNADDRAQETTSQHADGSAHSDAGAQGHNDAGAQGHNDADVAFARDMVPHHEQAIVMSDIILAKQGIDPRVTELAEQIKAAQGPEIATMQQWLTQWGASAPSGHEPSGHGPSGHEGHDMGGDPSAHAAMGMMTEEQLEQLRQAQGVDAERLFLTGMITHHEGAVTMAQTQVDTGQSQEAVELAHEIIETQQREIATMRDLLASL